MEQNKETKWYPVEYSGFWQIQNCEEYDGIDMLDADDVGEEQARENAILAASAPELLKQVDKWKYVAEALYKALEVQPYHKNGGWKTGIRNDASKQYQELCKKAMV